jgi:hypothetical protein
LICFLGTVSVIKRRDENYPLV